MYLIIKINLWLFEVWSGYVIRGGLYGKEEKFGIEFEEVGLRIIFCFCYYLIFIMWVVIFFFYL